MPAPLRLLLTVTLTFTLPLGVSAATDEYPPHPDSVIQPGVPQGELLSEAKKIASAIAARAPIAAETAKLNLRAAWEMSIANAIAYERDLQTICFATEDAKEGRAAFKEKRPPVFRRK